MHTPDDIKQGFSRRLRLFRERAGFSLADLAAQLGGSLSRQAISKYENGMSFPNSTHLLKLCDALHVTPDDLLDASPRALEGVEFRRLARFSAADQRKLRGSLELEFGRMHQLNDCLGLKPSFDQPLKGSGKISTLEKAEEAALQLRQKWELGLGAITSMVALLESKGIHVHLESTAKPFYGVSGWSGGIPVVVLNQHAAATDPVRLRFTAAHELGHLVMPIQESLTSKEQEKLCNRFAGAFLMPAETLRRELGPGKRTKLAPPELIALKAAYGLSLSALYQRAAQTGIINERQLKSWNITCRKAGWHKNEPGEYQGQESPRLFRQHLLRALAEERITESKAATLANRTIAQIRQMMTGKDLG